MYSSVPGGCTSGFWPRTKSCLGVPDNDKVSSGKIEIISLQLTNFQIAKFTTILVIGQ